MMKKLIALLMAMMMLLSCCFAEDEEEVQTAVEVLYVEAAGEQVKLAPIDAASYIRNTLAANNGPIILEK